MVSQQALELTSMISDLGLQIRELAGEYRSSAGFFKLSASNDIKKLASLQSSMIIFLTGDVIYKDDVAADDFRNFVFECERILDHILGLLSEFRLQNGEPMN